MDAANCLVVTEVAHLCRIPSDNELFDDTLRREEKVEAACLKSEPVVLLGR